MEERSDHISSYCNELMEDTTVKIQELISRRNNGDARYTDEQIDRYTRNVRQEAAKEIREHDYYCEKENREIRMQQLHYKETHCTASTKVESSTSAKPDVSDNKNPDKQSPVDYVMEKQQTEMPDITDADGGGD